MLNVYEWQWPMVDLFLEWNSFLIIFTIQTSHLINWKLGIQVSAKIHFVCLLWDVVNDTYDNGLPIIILMRKKPFYRHDFALAFLFFVPWHFICIIN